MRIAQLAITLCAVSAAAVCLVAKPAASRMTAPVWQERGSPQVPSGRVPSGQPVPSEAFKDLTAEGWQWALSIPAPQNPSLDATGENCMVGQRGSIWFLVGKFDGGTASRACTIPAGKQVFFPIVNFINIDTPNVCGQGPTSIPVAELRAVAAQFIDGVTSFSATLDNVPVLKLSRVKSSAFEVALPENNLFDAPCQNAGAGNVPAGVYSPAVDDGIYVMLKPLAIGHHMLSFQAENPTANFSLQINYDLNIVPVKLR